MNEEGKKKKKKRKERKGEGEEISGTWMLEQKIQRVCKWETPRWFSIGNLILALTIPINGEYYPFRFRITKLPTIRFVFVHRLVIKVYTRGGVQFREQSSDLTWLVEEAGEYYIHYFFSSSLSLSLSRSLSHSHSIVARFGGNNWSTLFPEITLLPRAISLLMKVIRTSCFVTFRRYKYFNFAPGRREGKGWSIKLIFQALERRRR